MVDYVPVIKLPEGGDAFAEGLIDREIPCFDLVGIIAGARRTRNASR
jgi:hypothetical protein